MTPNYIESHLRDTGGVLSDTLGHVLVLGLIEFFIGAPSRCAAADVEAF